ncbi:MAG TPA: hypothetical protein VHE09_04320 [Rhizomicrobium sp.]|jgi:hypothetical protein|nr:hypothetical protein [Rhizomicrobium sp.]
MNTHVCATAEKRRATPVVLHCAKDLALFPDKSRKSGTYEAQLR